MKPPPSPWLIAVFPVYFVSLWLFISFLISRLGGWAKLAKSYRALVRPQGRNFQVVSAGMGGTNYNNCLSATVADDGLYLQTWFLFRTFHEPLLIPWSAFSSFQQRQLFFVKRVVTEINLKNGGSVKLSLRTNALADVVLAKVSASDGGHAVSAWSN